MITIDRKSLAAGFAGLAFALLLSWMFVEGTRIELAQRHSGHGFVTAVSALVR
jgi:hypothetical protein